MTSTGKKDNGRALSRQKELLPFNFELLRKSVHILAVVLSPGMLWMGKHPSTLILGLAALLVLTLDILRFKASWFGDKMQNIFGALIRPEEQAVPGSKVALTGATYALISAFLLILIFPVHIAAMSFALFMVGDAAAAIIGQKYGKRTWARGEKTMEGSLAFLAAALLVVLLMPGVKFWIGAAASICACLAEALPGPLNDNLQAPLIAGAVMLLLSNL